MKFKLLLILTLIIRLKAGAQCFSVFRDMKVQPPAIPSGYKAYANDCPKDFYYVTYVKANPYPTNVYYHIWDGTKWTTLNEMVVKGGVMKLLKWNNRLIAFGGMKSIGKISAPKGRYIRFAEYKGGQWDTLPGGTLDSTDYRQYDVVGTNSGLYCSYREDSIVGNSKTHMRRVFSYDTVRKKFKKIIDCDGLWAYPFITGGNERLLLANVYSINGKPAGGFGYLIGDSIVLNSKNRYFGIDYSYGIDAINDHIYGVGVGLGMMYPPVLEYGDSFISYRQTPEFLGGGKILARNGMLVFQNILHNSSSVDLSLLCPGANKWRHMNMSAGLQDFDYLYVTSDGYFIQDLISGKVMELLPGTLVRGRAFFDFNSNCKFEEGKDSVLRYSRIEAEADHFKTVSSPDKDGYYSLSVPLDTIDVSTKNMDKTCGIKSVLALDKDSIYTLDIPVLKPTGYDLKLYSDAQSVIRWNAVSRYSVAIGNNGLAGDSVHFELSLDPKLKLMPQTDSNITSITKNVIRGKFKNMGFYEFRNILIPFWVDTAATKPNSVLCNTFSAYFYKNEIDSGNNTASFCQKVVYSRDPNHKECALDSIPPAVASALEYRIDFQNEGMADAIDVTLVDQLSWLLNANTVSNIESSHPYSMSIEGKIMTVDFRNIHLKPMDSSEALSKGYFKFRVETLPQIAENDSILNTASIYFDLNKALQTNTSKVMVRRVILPNNGVSKVLRQELFSIRPNPASSIVTIASASPQDIYIYNLTGQLMYTERAIRQATIDISGWPAGLYFVRSTGQSGKFIKVE